MVLTFVKDIFDYSIPQGNKWSSEINSKNLPENVLFNYW